MRGRIRHLDAASRTVILLTLALFGVALFLKGITHDLLLEAGVFLVSVKMILLAYHNSVRAETIEKKLDEIHALVRRLDREFTPGPDLGRPAALARQRGEPEQELVPSEARGERPTHPNAPPRGAPSTA